jgi:hypothetical protein
VNIDADLAVYVAGGAAVVLLIVVVAWRMRRTGTDVSPVSEQWLAERKARRTPD